jgi:DNA repair protein RadC
MEQEQIKSGHLAIKNWAEDEKPREKLLEKGPASLSNAELLGILINSGTRSRSAIDLARDVLEMAHNNLQELGRLSVAELQKTKGIGKARAITIASALELGRRRQLNEVPAKPVITKSIEAARIFIPLMADLPHEVFGVIYLNQASRLIKHEILSSGGLTSTVVDVRMILKNALLCNASQIVIAHNHPSGSLDPSRADQDLTNKLKTAAIWMDIRVIDHLIIGQTSYFSMADGGYM